MNLLTIETTCDETAAAVVTDQLTVLSSVVASQETLHQRFGGVVPEIASRAHVERILPVIHQAIEQSGITLSEINAVAVANTPGLSGSLLVGLTAAKSLAWALDVPLVAINHLQAHIYACRIASGEEIFPCIGLIVSGGHSNIYRCDGSTDFTLLGGTIDDAAGEAFDKVASLLGLPYPGGPSLSRAAQQGDPARYRFPRPLLDDRTRLDFSFSGLKTAVRYLVAGTGKLEGPPQLEPQLVADVAASFEQAVVDCLVGKSELALKTSGYDVLCVGGGVAANKVLRRHLEESATRHGYRLYIPPMSLCTDNAVMGAIALERLVEGTVEPLHLDIQPGVERPPR